MYILKQGKHFLYLKLPQLTTSWHASDKRRHNFYNIYKINYGFISRLIL